MSPLHRTDPLADPGEPESVDPGEAGEWRELTELPAAVVCAVCGRADCGGGCEQLNETTAPSMSGVVLVVPWERPNQSAWSRFWTTTRLSVEGAEVFFTNLPDGPVAPALSYATLAELLAAGACVVVFAALGLSLLALLLPVFTHALLSESSGRAAVGRVIVAAWLSFSALLVGVHALHGVALHRLALRTGHAPSRATLNRAIRFGLYSASFDVAACPIGLAWLLSLRTGARRLLDLLFSASLRATTAMLRGVYALDEPALSRVRRRGVWLSIAGVLAGLALCAVVIVAAAL